MQDAVDALVDHYINVRLHQGIGYVTPAVKHMGLEGVVFEARISSLAPAREERLRYNRQTRGTELDQERSDRQEAESVTLREPNLSERQ